MSLYLIDDRGNWEGKPLKNLIERMIDAGVLVPVERCKHRKIDGHWVTAALWCPGAGIGGETDE